MKGPMEHGIQQPQDAQDSTGDDLAAAAVLRLAVAADPQGFFALADVDHSDGLSRDEFTDACRKKAGSLKPSEQLLHELFKDIDADGNGVLSLGELDNMAAQWSRLGVEIVGKEAPSPSPRPTQDEAWNEFHGHQLGRSMSSMLPRTNKVDRMLRRCILATGNYAPGYLDRERLPQAIDQHGNLFCWQETRCSSPRILNDQLKAHEDVEIAPGVGLAPDCQKTISSPPRSAIPSRASTPPQSEEENTDNLRHPSAWWKSAAEGWIAVRNKPTRGPSLDRLEDQPTPHPVTLPQLSFKTEWTGEFENAQTHVHGLQIKYISVYVGIPMTVALCLNVVRSQDTKWGLLASAGQVLMVVTCCGALVIFSSTSASLRRFRVVYFEIVAAASVWCAFTGLFWTPSMTGLRRAFLHDDVEYKNNLSYSMDESAALPTVECEDYNAAQTLMKWDVFDEPGCASRLVYGTYSPLLVAASLLCHVLSMSPQGAIVTKFGMLLSCSVISLVLGQHEGPQWATVLLLCVAGAIDVYHCRLRRAAEMKEFVLHKVHGIASEESRALLHTLIPPNVLNSMSSPDASVCTDIPHVTVLFCSLQFNVASDEDFKFFRCVLDALDKSVQCSGMFKYQHVSCGASHYYIVGCPRMASPFDSSQQYMDYPSDISEKMIELGRQLSRVTSCLASPSRPLHLKVGINW